jgi:hypothetical protein
MPLIGPYYLYANGRNALNGKVIKHYHESDVIDEWFDESILVTYSAIWKKKIKKETKDPLSRIYYLLAKRPYLQIINGGY